MTAIISSLQTWRLRRRLHRLHRDLGIPPDHAARHGLALQPEARELIATRPDVYGREQRLLPSTARAWERLMAAATEAGVELQLVSAFRSIEYQAGIVRRKLEKGLAITDILRVSAAPGYSEHHSGRAVDLTTPGYPVLEEVFEESEAFAWLSRRAGEFGFRMSYPRGNPHGVAYEPWHWAWWGDRSG